MSIKIAPLRYSFFKLYSNKLAKNRDEQRICSAERHSTIDSKKTKTAHQKTKCRKKSEDFEKTEEMYGTDKWIFQTNFLKVYLHETLNTFITKLFLSI